MINFPAKKLFGKTDKEVIEKRATQLNGISLPKILNF